jgi:pyrroloquinoline quinone biosynthesis protein B
MRRCGSSSAVVSVAGAALLAWAGAQTPASPPQSVPAAAWELVVLGIAQDAGIPQLGCTQVLCTSIRAGTRRPERVASLGLVHRGSGRAFLFDATPDLPSQVHTLTGGRSPDAVFLTHAHIGHYTGLIYLGREAIDARAMPVYATARMTTFLTANGPWSGLVSRKNIALQTLVPDQAVDLGDGLRVTAFTVPHRDEFTDTVGFRIETPAKTAVYIPDIDQWQKWVRQARDVLAGADYALLDGTFASADEIPGRSIADIPHPLMPATRTLLGGGRAQIWFIHLNHTNREIDARDVVRDGQRFPM